MITLSEAARRTGRTKQAIKKAIDTGRVRGERDALGRWHVDESSLLQAYQLAQPVDQPGAQTGLQVEVEVLRTKLAMTEQRAAELRDEAAAWRAQADHWRLEAQALLSRPAEQPEADYEPDPYQAEPWPEPARPWWRRWVRR